MRTLRDRIKALAAESEQRPKQPAAEPARQVESLASRYPLGESVGLLALGDALVCDAHRLFTEPPPDGAPADARSMLFYDLETTGLHGAGMYAFLLGMAYFEDGALALEQVWIRSPHGESALLDAFSRRCDAVHTLVSFNGTSFDTPLMLTRARLNRRELSVPRQLDLLHAARRMWRLRLKSCTLVNLEEHVLGVRRENDIDGAAIPGRYFEAMRAGDDSLMDDILEHNRQDLLSLVGLYAALSAGFSRPLELEHDQDVYSAARALERFGHVEAAEQCYKTVTDDSIKASCALSLSMLLKRQQRWEEAVCLWEGLARQSDCPPQAYIELAKFYEHRQKDPLRALRVVEEGVLSLERRRLQGKDATLFFQLRQRVFRLKQKADRRASGN